MLEQIVTVVRVAGTTAWVAGDAGSACGHCGSAAQCGTGALARWLGTRRRLLALPNLLQARPGDRVVIGVPEGLLVQAAAVAYLLPLLAMAATAISCDAAGVGNTGVALAGLAGFVLGLGLVGRITGRAGGWYQPQMLRYRPVEVYLSQPIEGVHP